MSDTTEVREIEGGDAFCSPVLVRAGFGGALMGLANLVPGISGGTMLLAAGVFPQFVQAVADITRFRFSWRAVLVLGAVVASAGIMIGLCAGVIGHWVIANTWMAYSVFIGLTLGGVPLILRSAHEKAIAFWVGAVSGFALMVVLAFLQMSGVSGGVRVGDNFFLMVLAGLSGASAMVLPGISGGYLLLLLGVYETILLGIEQFSTAFVRMDTELAFDVMVRVILPVGIGVIVGVIAVSNLVRYVLRRFPSPMYGVLLGLLVGAVFGLWPFQRGIEPIPGTMLRGQLVERVDDQLVFAQTGIAIEPEDYERAFFRPSLTQVGGAFALIISGIAITFAISRIGNGASGGEDIRNALR